MRVKVKNTLEDVLIQEIAHYKENVIGDMPIEQIERLVNVFGQSESKRIKQINADINEMNRTQSVEKNNTLHTRFKYVKNRSFDEIFGYDVEFITGGYAVGKRKLQ